MRSERLNVRIHPEHKTKLKALVKASGKSEVTLPGSGKYKKSQADIIEEAIDLLFKKKMKVHSEDE